MKIIYTKHALEKFKELEQEGWHITKIMIRNIIKNPEWKGTTRYKQETAIGSVNEKHILRIVLDRKGGIIKVITFHIGRRGKYESTL